MDMFHSSCSMSLFYPGLAGTLREWSKCGCSYIDGFRDWRFVGSKSGLYGLALHEVVVNRIGGCEELAGWIVIRHDCENTVLRLAASNRAVDVDYVWCNTYSCPSFGVSRRCIGADGGCWYVSIPKCYSEDAFDAAVDDVTRSLIYAVVSFG